MPLKVKSGKIALLVAILSFMALTQNIASARISGVDLDIQRIEYDHSAGMNQTVHFTIFVKNKGTEATQSLSVGLDFGNGIGMGFMGPIVIESGQTKTFTVGSTYTESGKFVVRAEVNTLGDVNLRNNFETGIINIK